MSNPYEPPRAAPRSWSVTTFSSTSSEDDPELARLRKRLGACGVAVGCIFGAVGAGLFFAVVAAAVNGFFAWYHAATGGVALVLLIVSGFAALGRPRALFVATAISASWLTYLTVYLPMDLAKKDVLGPQTTLFIYLFLATPGVAALPFGNLGTATARVMRLRMADLIRQNDAGENRPR